MNFDYIFPNREKSIKKYERLYKADEAIMEMEKDRKAVKQGYMVTLLLFIISFGKTLYQLINANGEIKDLVIIVAVFIGLFVFLFKTKESKVEKQIKKRKEEIIDDFPEFIHRVVLLLNTGMVTESVLLKIALDYKDSTHREQRRPLYEGLLEIAEKTKKSNTPLIKELCTYAGTSGVRQLMRFSAIIDDNYTRGSTLADKLEGEGALLWQERKKIAEEKAKLAETKLAMPLMLLLLSLILITTAPMLLSM